jgi:hypothetical protein
MAGSRRTTADEAGGAPVSSTVGSKQIAFGLTRAIVTALGERGDAVNDPVYSPIRRNCNLL